jgi:hypothetical protein
MEIKVNADEWKGLSKEDRDKVQDIIGAHFKDAKVSGSSAVQIATQFLAQPRVFGFNFGKPFCTAACGVAEAAAVTACAALSGPAVPICIAAAHAAGNLCRSKC